MVNDSCLFQSQYLADGLEPTAQLIIWLDRSPKELFRLANRGDRSFTPSQMLLQRLMHSYRAAFAQRLSNGCKQFD